MDLRERKTSSRQQDLDTAQATERTTAAAVKQARANVETARLDLGYATVTAPIAGRAGRALVTEGALVGQGEATLLTTVEQIDPDLRQFQPVRAGDREPCGGPRPADVGSGARSRWRSCCRTAPLTRIPGPSTFRIWRWTRAPAPCRCAPPCPIRTRPCCPGMFVNLRLTAGADWTQAFVLPQAALARDAQGAYVLVRRRGRQGRAAPGGDPRHDAQRTGS